MRKGKKRKPDLRCIRTTKTYKVGEIALALDRDVRTVRSWFHQGLPTLGEQKPVLISGAELKTWLKAKWSERRQQCKPNELFCFKCRKPSKPRADSVQITARNEKTLTIKAQCSVCSTRMNRAGSMAKRAEIEEIFHASKRAMQHLTGCGKASTRRTSETSSEAGYRRPERNTVFNNKEAAQ